MQILQGMTNCIDCHCIFCGTIYNKANAKVPVCRCLKLIMRHFGVFGYEGISPCTLLASILREKNYRIGLEYYTSIFSRGKSCF